MNPPTTADVVTPSAVIDLGAIEHNVRTLREYAGSAQVMAVVKADGYGHGAVEVARAALRAGAAELGVVTVAEALALREAGITAPVLTWMHPQGTDFAPALTADVQIGVSSLRQLGDVVEAARRAGVVASITVKADTGLSRNGVAASDLPDLVDALARAQAEGAVHVRGLMSHLAHGDEPDHPTNDLQAQRFRDLIAQARRGGVEFEVAHLANSPAVLTRPDLAFDIVRPGIAMYGLNPVPGLVDPDLIPAMTLSAPVVMVRPIRAGDGVSYSHTWIADRDTTVALIPLGYADGVFRALGGRMEVSINGIRRPSVGRVCMDQFLVDLGPGAVDVVEGDRAILFGPGTSGEPTAAEWADLIGTIHYEVVTSPRGRITRVYTQAGRA
ncbi:alanine racemase [Mycolicibacterium confluentis]|uniref:Alanine racemase n=1 Tax=Mycolicibacterium confluentis TaxID=28047 RepID=A0A7I7Y0A5_9MYCO|nr:alanine racemase [Mycolicibacterium confluentis]MCV7320023.1 alanine racemase [Mycolicibacterium confluentis]ORV34573.1 alanine racemase [Mycolicibacterium confluentis]BBZ35058.1 alanine racemase [Mycolicibacterium confluentis]